MKITCATPTDLDINLARSWLTVMQIQLLTILGPSVTDWPEGVFQAPSGIAAKFFQGEHIAKLATKRLPAAFFLP
jgi:hypothetical protein